MAKIDFEGRPLEVRLAAHAIGMVHRRPYIRHGKMFYKPYRNYFATHDQSDDFPIWEKLVKNNYARLVNVPGYHYRMYKLTRSGLDWLGGELGIAIHDEED